MESESIKKVVAQVGRLVASGDKSFHTDEAKNVVTTILMDLTRGFRRSPTLAVATVQYLVDEGFDLGKVRGTAYNEFAAAFGSRMSRMTPAQSAHLRTISRDLFDQSKAA